MAYFSIEFSCKANCQYEDTKSITAKHVTPAKSCTSLSKFGIGQAILTVAPLRSCISITILNCAFEFGFGTTCEAESHVALGFGTEYPILTNSSTYLFKKLRCFAGYRRARAFTGTAESLSLISKGGTKAESVFPNLTRKQSYVFLTFQLAP